MVLAASPDLANWGSGEPGNWGTGVLRCWGSFPGKSDGAYILSMVSTSASILASCFGCARCACWDTGALEHRGIGTHGHWGLEALRLLRCARCACCFPRARATEVLVQWSIGLLVHWGIGAHEHQGFEVLGLLPRSKRGAYTILSTAFTSAPFLPSCFGCARCTCCSPRTSGIGALRLWALGLLPRKTTGTNRGLFRGGGVKKGPRVPEYQVRPPPEYPSRTRSRVLRVSIRCTFSLSSPSSAFSSTAILTSLIYGDVLESHHYSPQRLILEYYDLPQSEKSSFLAQAHPVHTQMSTLTAEYCRWYRFGQPCTQRCKKTLRRWFYLFTVTIRLLTTRT